MHWLSHWAGLDNGSGAVYLFYSGFAGFILSLSVVGGLVTLYRKHECHQNRCWRIGKHPAANGVLVLCRKHHPDPTMHEGNGGKLTAEVIAEMHKIAQRR